MKQSDHLFQLIKSLDKNEKRYFKLYASQQGDEKLYLELFDILDRQKTFDDKKLKRAIKNKKLLARLAFNKNYLYNLLLRAMRNYSAGSTLELQLKEMLNNVGFLYRKGLYAQCNKLLERIKKQAIHYEKHLLHLEALRWERSIRLLTGETKSMTDQNMRTLEKLKNIFQYQDLTDRTYILQTGKGIIRSDELQAEHQSIVQNPLLKDVRHASGFESVFFYYSTHIIYAHAAEDHEAACSHSRLLIEYMEQYPHLIIEEVFKYIAALGNLMNSLVALKRFDELDKEVKKMERFRQNPSLKDKNAKLKIFTFLNETKMSAYIARGDFKKGLELIPEVESELEKYAGMINDATGQFNNYYFAYIHIGLGNYKKAIPYLNKLLATEPPGSEKDLFLWGRLLSLIVHYELENEDLIESMSRSVYRYLYKKKKLHLFEKVILNFIRTQPKGQDHASRIHAFENCKKEFAPLMKNPYEAPAMGYFHIIPWLESKIQKRPFDEMVKKTLVN